MTRQIRQPAPLTQEQIEEIRAENIRFLNENKRRRAMTTDQRFFEIVQTEYPDYQPPEGDAYQAVAELREDDEHR